MNHKISIVVAMADNNAIGKDQQLLWRLPNDMKFFKELTSGHTVIMGRKTFESLPKGALPNRRNIVLTSKQNPGYENVEIYRSMLDVLDACKEGEELFIIGGGAVYRQTLDIAQKMYITHVHHTFEDADTFFPEIDYSLWEKIEEKNYSADEKHLYPYTFSTYRRR